MAASTHLEHASLFAEKKPCQRVSRMELMFSETVPTTEQLHLTCIRDIERNGYKFTEGCGKISSDLSRAGR